MKYKATVTFDTDISDKDGFWDNLSEALDNVDCNELEIVDIEEIRDEDD